MSLIQIERNPSGRQLLVFGIAWLVFFACWGGACQMRGRTLAAEIFWAAAVAVPLLGAASRMALRTAYVAVSYATYPLGYVISHVVLAVVYFFVLTPIGLAMRLLGNDPLSRKFEPGAKSYWKRREKAKSAESYFNQH
jgi:ABC-type uncharacterized transport system permease subunit